MNTPSTGCTTVRQPSERCCSLITQHRRVRASAPANHPVKPGTSDDTLQTPPSRYTREYYQIAGCVTDDSGTDTSPPMETVSSRRQQSPRRVELGIEGDQLNRNRSLDESKEEGILIGVFPQPTVVQARNGDDSHRRNTTRGRCRRPSATAPARHDGRRDTGRLEMDAGGRIRSRTVDQRLRNRNFASSTRTRGNHSADCPRYTSHLIRSSASLICSRPLPRSFFNCSTFSFLFSSELSISFL